MKRINRNFHYYILWHNPYHTCLLILFNSFKFFSLQIDRINKIKSFYNNLRHLDGYFDDILISIFLVPMGLKNVKSKLFGKFEKKKVIRSGWKMKILLTHFLLLHYYTNSSMYKYLKNMYNCIYKVQSFKQNFRKN